MRLEYNAKVIVAQTDKSAKILSSYKPISLFPILSKIL